jgi:hypothetical protein
MLEKILADAANGYFPHLLPEGEVIWAQQAPGNATSARAFQAAGFRPVGAEVLLVRG